MQINKLPRYYDSFIQNIKNLNTNKKLKIILISTFIWGIFSHGMVLFNKYNIHDDVSALFEIGTTYTSGRWMLEILRKITWELFGQGAYSLPVFNGMVSIFFIALASYFITVLLKIQKPSICISISGILVSFPTITGLFGYMFTAPYYSVSILFIIKYMIGRVAHEK